MTTSKDLTTEQKKEALERVGWKIYLQSDDNRDVSWIQGFAFTPDHFMTRTRAYYEDEPITSEMILDEIVNKAWNHYIKD